MNRTIALLILGVILLAMALIMVNQYMTQPEDSATTPPASTASAPPAMQEASPQAVLSQLEQRAATSELAPKGSPSSPPAKQAMPAWATNGPGLTPPAVPAAKPVESQASTATTPAPGVASQLGAASPAKSATPSALTQASAQASAQTEQPRAEPAKTVTAKAEPAKTETAKTEPPKANPPKAKPKGPKTIKKIAVIRMDDEVAVRLEGSEALTYKTMHLKGPDRLVVDLDDQWAIKAPGVPENKYVSNVRIGKQGDKTRIVIDLRQAPQSVRYIKRGPEGLDVRIK